MVNGFFDFVRSFFGKTNSSVLGVDIGSSSIKVVQLRKQSGKAILETYGELSLGPYGGVEVGRATNLPAEKMAEALKDLLREANVTTRNCGVAIPISSSLVSFIRMPTRDKKQMDVMIPIEARKYIPVPISEVNLDWWIIPEDTSVEALRNEAVEKNSNLANPNPAEQKMSTTEVLVVAIHNDILTKFMSVVENSGLTTTFFEIEIFSAVRALLDQSIATQMILDMGSSSTKIYIVERGILRSSHSINRGSQDITLAISKSMGITPEEAEQMKKDFGVSGYKENAEVEAVVEIAIENIFAEAQRILLDYEKRYNKAVSRIVLTGGAVMLKGFLEKAKANLETEVVPGNAFGKIETPAFFEEVIRSTGTEFAVAIGIALRKLQELG